MACFPQYLMGEPGCRLPGERGDVAPRHESVMRIAPLKPGLRPARGDDALRLADIVGVGLECTGRMRQVGAPASRRSEPPPTA